MKPHTIVVAAIVLTIFAVTANAGAGRAKKTQVHGVGWYVSFHDAKAEARRTGKPILLLSMFGRLDEEMPCANARTLRATLFKDSEFKKLANSEVIPAWEMVRPVPRVTIDLGDGKRVVRTVRGNAVMYLCNSEGKVIDAFPGVYTARDFLPEVRKSILNLHGKAWKEVRAYHQERGAIPRRRTEITAGKAMLESPTLNLVGARPLEPAFGVIPSGRLVADRKDIEAKERFARAVELLADMSLRPMNSSEAYERITGAKLADGNSNAAARILAEDSRRNMSTVRGVIHLWLASEDRFLDPLEARYTVLSSILKIPYKDPYFGLKDVLLPGTPN